MGHSDIRAGAVGIVAFAMSFLFAIAGTLLIAPWVAILGLFALPLHRDFWRFERTPWALIGAALFLVWMTISFLWSPHDDPGQIWRTGLGIPLYILFVARIGQVEGAWRRRIEAAIVFLVFALGLFLLYESLFDGSLARGYRLADEGMRELRPEVLDMRVNRSLGHAAVPLLMLSLPAALIAWRSGGPVMGAVFIGLAGVAAFSFSTDVNTVAFLLGLVAAGLAALAPRTALALLFGISAGLMLVVPLLTPILIAHLPSGVVESLPLSWIWRLEIWSYAIELIRDKPLFGHGLDASRPLNRELVLQGFTVEALPLHPHNASLQIWLETGAVGATLLAFTLAALGRRIASAPHLSRLQAVGVVWVFVVYASQVVFSYGVWQEWHQGTVALAATSVFFLGAKKPLR